MNKENTLVMIQIFAEITKAKEIQQKVKNTINSGFNLANEIINK